MTRLLGLLLSLILGVLLLPVPLAAQTPASCVQPGIVTRADLGDRDLATIQLGLRTVLAMGDAGLDDGALGPVTRGALRELCQRYDFINADPANDVEETLDLAMEYGELARVVPNWPSALATLENLVVPGAARLDLRVLRLAGPPALTAGVLAEDASPLCETIDVGGIGATARPALDALLRSRNVPTLCADLLVTETTLDTASVLSSLSGLQGAYDAIETLQSTAFVTWLAQDLQTRLIQLAGTNAAVIDLIDRFENQRPRAREFKAPTPTSCKLAPDNTTVRYFSFGQKQLEILANTVDVGKLLEPLMAEDAEGARTANDLWQDMAPLLQDGLDQCALDRIEGLVLGPDRLGLGYQLDAERVADFKLSPLLIDSEPILAPLIELRVSNDADLLTGLRVNLTKALTEALNGQVEVAAELLAGAAEEVRESLDVARVDPENFDEIELPPLLGITDPSVKAALDTITNEAFKRAIFDGPFIVGTNDEILKAEVRNLLRPLIAGEVEKAVNRDIALITSAIRSDWRVTEAMITRINALPEVARVAGDATGANLETKMESLLGLEYPNEQLLRAALRNVKTEVPNAPPLFLSPGLVNRAVALSQVRIQDAESLRVTGPLAVDKCGCVPPKGKDVGNEVYGFYPFWLSPLADPPDAEEDAETENEASAEAEGDSAAADEAPKLPQPIDYTFTSRVAFYGMEFDFKHPEEGADRRSLELKYLGHWLEMRRDFINSAHQHRAKVDVAFDMRNWREWTEVEQTYVVDRIVQFTAPIPRLAGRSFKDAWATIPTLFDSMQPDGVTLIFEDYVGAPEPDVDASTLVRLVQRVQNALSERGQSVNLGFNVAFFDNNGNRVDDKKGVLDDLRELLIKGIDDEKTVDRVLVFLPRGTSPNKKLLRQRLDFGDYRGPEREVVLESLIPVLPGAAHEEVLQSARSNDEGDTKAGPFSQYEDDLIYFAKSFAGVGFWPIPLQPGEIDGVEVGQETSELRRIMLKNWEASLLPAQLKDIEPQYREFCTWACPRRAGIGLVTMGVFAVMAGLVGFSYYSGTIDKVAFKWKTVHLGVLFVLASLFVLSTCDPVSTAPPALLICFLVLLLLLFAADFVQRMRNGPKP